MKKVKYLAIALAVILGMVMLACSQPVGYVSDDTEAAQMVIPLLATPPTAWVNIDLTEQSFGTIYRVIAIVTVTENNASGPAISGAIVYGNWSGDYSATVSCITGNGGRAMFLTNFFVPESGIVTFTVTKIVKNGQECVLSGETSDSTSSGVEYDLTISSTEGGSVTEPDEGMFTYDEGTVVNLVATPGAGYRFAGWTGDVVTIANINAAATNITMNGDYAITANFVALYDLTISSTEGGSVTEPGEGMFTYDEGTVVGLVATPGAGYRFVNWTGDVSTVANVTAGTTTIRINGDYSISANFVRRYTLTVTSATGGAVTAPGEGIFAYDAGTVVSLLATPVSGYRFANWTGDVGAIKNTNAASTTITMRGNYSITANFEAIAPWVPPTVQYGLIISPSSGGSVTSPGVGIFTYGAGTVVNLVATPASGYRFANWTGGVGTIANVYAASTTIAMNGDYFIIANFEEVPPPQLYPTVTTQAATDITTSSTRLNMSYTVGDFSPVEVCYAYKKSTDPAWSYTAWVSKTADGTHAEVLTGLEFNTTYHFKSRLKYNGTVVGGTTLQFTTHIPSPSGSGGCFIATAAYGTPAAEQIDLLREFRDVVLLRSTVGSQFVALYYWLSPPIADFVSGTEFLRTLVRELLVDPIVWVVQARGDTLRS